jgi:quinol monooxygenase YgiN
MAPLELSAHMTVRPGCLEGFKKQAAELIRITQEKDTHTLRYDWFLSLDGTECEVREAYTDPEGLIEHNRNILEARTKLFKDYADDHFMTFYGEVSEPLLSLLKTLGRTQVVLLPSGVGAIRRDPAADSGGGPRGHAACVSAPRGGFP